MFPSIKYHSLEFTTRLSIYSSTVIRTALKNATSLNTLVLHREMFAITWRLTYLQTKEKEDKTWKDLEGFMCQVLYFIMELNWSISEKKTWETIEQNTFTHFLELFTHAKSCNAFCIRITTAMNSYRQQYKSCNQPRGTKL